MYSTQIILLMLSVLVMMGLGQNMEDWIDPDDLLNFDPSSKTMVKRKGKLQPPQDKEEATNNLPTESQTSGQCPECKCEQTPCPAVPECPEKECACNQASLPLLRNYVKTLLANFDNQTPTGTRATEYVMRISLTADQILILDRFVEKGSPGHVHDVHEILTAMAHTVTTSSQGKMERFALLLEHKIGLSLHRLIQISMLIALASVVLLIEIKLQIPWRRRVGQLIVLMFVISVPWTWYELYKQAEIEQHSKTVRKIPSECQEAASDYWRTLLSYISLQKDKCTEYYEHIMIDPIIRVPPTKAIAVTFVRFFMAPLKDVGAAFSEFIKALLVDLPVTYYPFAIIMVTVFFFLFLFMMFGYSIRLPFFLTIEKSPVQPVADSQVHGAITDGNNQILEQLQDITDRMKASELQFNEKIEDLKQVQQMAIEYNTSSTSMYESPSISKPGGSGDKKTKASKLSAKNDGTKSNLNVKEADCVSGAKKDVDDKTVRTVQSYNDFDNDDDDDDDDARKGPVVDTLLAESLSHGNIDIVK